jgi:hypothetical protein
VLTDDWGDVIAFEEIPISWLTGNLVMTGSVGPLVRAMRIEWANRGRPQGESLEAQWDVICVSAAMESGKWVYDATVGKWGGFISNAVVHPWR